MSVLYTREQLDFIALNRKTLTAKQLANAYNKRFNADKSYKAIAATCKRYGWKSSISGRFSQGFKPWNYGTKGLGLTKANITSFKSGEKSPTQKPIGSERINSKDGYTMIKVAEPRKWKHKHVVIWEANNGPVPKGHVIRFIDGDILNLDPENLELINRLSHLRMNKNKLSKAPTELKPIIRIMSKIEASLFEKQRRQKMPG